MSKVYTTLSAKKEIFFDKVVIANVPTKNQIDEMPEKIVDVLSN